MSDIFTVGDTTRVSGAWADTANNNTPVDPSSVLFSVTSPDNVVVSYEYGVNPELIRESTGVYAVDILLNQAGTWSYHFWSTGDGASDEVTSFLVNAVICTQSCITPEDSEHDGCPVLGKTRTLIVAKGQCACVSWAVRDQKGRIIDLTDIDHVVVRFQDALGLDPRVYEVDATVTDGAAGLIYFVLPKDRVFEAGIQQMQIGLMDVNDNLLGAELGYLSVERGLFGNVMNPEGPLTINEVRLQLRDTMTENNLLDDVEFDDVEIVHSILRPVSEWNEKPPPVAYFNAGTFPYRYHWLNAICANLLMIAAHWYERNHLAGSHGGITVDDRAKANPYIAVSQLLRKDWLDFVQSKKVSINASLFYGNVGSQYYGSPGNY